MGPSKGRKARKSKTKAHKDNGSKNPVPENEPELSKDNSHPSAHHPSEILVSVKTGTATKEDLLAVTKGPSTKDVRQMGRGGGFKISDIPGRGEGGWFVKVRTSENF